MNKIILTIFFIFISISTVYAEEYTNETFKYGIASGDPLQDKVIIWSKVESREKEANVFYEVSENENFEKIKDSGSVLTNENKDYTFKVDVNNLRADTTYYYRFKYNNTYSPIGITKTLPKNPRKFKMAVVSCQHFSDGYFNAYKHIVDDKPDVIVMLGDFIYEYTRTPSTRQDPSGYAKDLETYRKKYQVYLQDKHLRQAMSKIPMIAIWDDHEVLNDYSGVQMRKTDPERLKAAYQTFFNYVPIREQEGNKIYRTFKIGDLLELFMIDGRQYRDEDPCHNSLSINFDCTHKAYEENHTYLGKEQLNWLITNMNNSTSQWKVMGNNTALFELSYFGNFFNFDQWDGFYAEKQKFLDSINNKVNNLIFLTGDIHTFIQANIFYKGKKIADEFTATSITSRSIKSFYLLNTLVPMFFPNIKYFNAESRGYILADFNTRKADIYFYGVSTVAKPESEKILLRHMEVIRKK